MSPAQDVGEDEGGNDGGVGFDDEAGGVFPEFAPGDFFVGDCSGIGAVTGGGIADLAEIGPQRHVRALPPPIWKKPSGVLAVSSVYHLASSIMYSTPLRITVTFFTLPPITCAANIFPSVESSQPGTKTGRSFSAAAIIQLSLGSI